MYINDGKGTGSQAEVDVNNRLQTLSVSLAAAQRSAIDGDTYNVNTGTINLTTANESGLIYLKNTGSTDLHITSIGYLLGNSTGGTGDTLMTVKRNPTTGTLISGATNVDVNINKNFGSTQTLSVNAYKGAEGNTVTDGDEAYYSLLPGVSRSYVITTGTLVLPQGSSISVSMTPPAGNTSVDVQVFFAITDYRL